MADTDQKLVPPPDEHPLLDKPAEEKLREEVENLKRELEEERRKSQKAKEHPHIRPRRRTLWLLGLAILVALVLAFFLGWLPHHRREQRLAAEARKEAAALPTVLVIQAVHSPANTELMLPGNIQALVEAPILARADGYLKNRYVDIGDRVKKDQLLGQIEAPDLDQQVAQGRAQLSQALAAEKQANSNLAQGKANESLARITAVRWANLFKRGAVASQENDQYQSQYQAQQANVAALMQAVSAAEENTRAARANLDRLIALQSYEYVRAPFNGVVTYRNIDVGALISTGNTLLFRIAQIDKLLTYIYVPQANAPSIQVGQPAQLLVLEYPSRRFPGTITRTARELDPNTRTLLAEVQLPNPDGTLLPGMFAQVNLNNSRLNPPILIPGDALIVRSNGTFVGIAREDSSQNQQNRGAKVVHLQPVTVGRDYGTQIEILTGLNAGDLVIVNPNDNVQEGAKVNIQMSKSNPNQQPKPPGGANQDQNREQLAPQTGAEPNPKNPSKENTRRGPGI